VAAASQRIFNTRLVALVFVLSKLARLDTSRRPDEPLILRRAGFLSAIVSRLRARLWRNVCIALSSFQRTKAPQIHHRESVGIPAPPDVSDARCRFAFVSVAPFRGTFQAYDANLTMSTHFFVRPAILSTTRFTAIAPRNVCRDLVVVSRTGKAQVAR
jgi:hypothetical protein